MEEFFTSKTNRFIRIALSLMLVLILCVTSSVSVFAAETNSSNEHPNSSEWIIGSADEKPQSRIPNWLNIDWDATATQILIYVQNVGVDTVDIFSGTVTVEDGTPVPFTALNIAPLTTRTITVTVNMQQCYEDIVVKYYAVDGGTEFGEGSSPGHREIPSSLSSLWVKGSFSTVYGSINYHYSTHGAEVGSTNIVDYATKASTYRSAVVSDISNLTTTELNNKYTITLSSGATAAHKYKHKTNLQFAILSDSGYYIVPYGK